jgi:hypothetical protein
VFWGEALKMGVVMRLVASWWRDAKKPGAGFPVNVRLENGKFQR